MNLSTTQQSQIDEANDWVDRLRDGRKDTRRAFQEWLRESPGNVGEYLIFASIEEVLESLPRDELLFLHAVFDDEPD